MQMLTKPKADMAWFVNHIYEVELNTIFGLGTPVLIPDEEIEIIPQKPTPDAFYLGASYQHTPLESRSQ